MRTCTMWTCMVCRYYKSGYCQLLPPDKRVHVDSVCLLTLAEMRLFQQGLEATIAERARQVSVCPHCHYEDTRVVDEGGAGTKRTYQCQLCWRTWYV